MIEEKVSIIIPSYNNAQFLTESVESAINQTYQNLEIIIIEGGSTDSSLDIITKFAVQDPRIKVIIHEKNQGVSKARNDGITAASGNYIALLDSDDVMLPSRIEELYLEISKNPEYGLVHSDVSVIDEFGNIKGRIIGKDQYSKGYIRGEVLRRRGCHIGYPMFRKKCLDSVGYYDESLRGGEDYDLYTRMTRDFPVAYVKKPLILYRRHGSNASSKLSLMVTDYKKYLDKTFTSDSESVYGDVRYDAYAHYYVDYLNILFHGNKKIFFLFLFEGLIHSLKKSPIVFLITISSVLKVVTYRMKTISLKKFCSLRNCNYIQIGW